MIFALASRSHNPQLNTHKESGVCHPPSPLYASRAAALAAGIPNHVPISTVNRLCSSGLMAIRNIAHSIKSGEVTLGIAVGVESMSTEFASSYSTVSGSWLTLPVLGQIPRYPTLLLAALKLRTAYRFVLPSSQGIS